jgi:hypothetical protein
MQIGYLPKSKKTSDVESIYSNIQGVYLLFNNDKIVYVGKSDCCIKSRILLHLQDKQFDYFSIIQVENIEVINVLETALILYYRPFYNKIYDVAVFKGITDGIMDLAFSDLHKCDFCHNEFVKNHRKQKFCSNTCRTRHHFSKKYRAT